MPSTATRKLALYLLALPLALGLYAVSQLYRSYAEHHHHEELEQLRHTLEQAPHALVDIPRLHRYEGVAREQLPQRLQDQLEDLQSHVPALETRTALAWGALLSFGFAMFFGFRLRLRIAQDARHAWSSPRAFDEVLDSGWPQLGRRLQRHLALIQGGLLAMVLFEVIWCLEYVDGQGWLVLPMMLALGAGLVASLRLSQRLRQDLASLAPVVLEMPGKALDAQQSPALWRWLGSLGLAVGAPQPTHLVIGERGAVFLTSSPVRLSGQAAPLSGSLLHLPAPWLRCLSQQEGAALIAHELAHFSDEEPRHGLRLAAVFQHQEMRLIQLREQNRRFPNPLHRPGIWAMASFGQALRPAYEHWCLHQERVADQAAARIAGPFTTACALLRLSALGASLPPSGHDRLQLVPEVLDDVHLHPHDIHPPTRQRIEQLGVPIDAQLLQQAARPVQPEQSGWFDELLDPVQDRATRRQDTA